MAASSSSLVFSTLNTSSSPSSSLLSFTRSLCPFPKPHNYVPRQTKIATLSIKAQDMDFSGSFFEGGLEGDDDPPITPGSGITAPEDKEEPQCPPGLRKYETMAILRPDMSEDERLTLTQIIRFRLPMDSSIDKLKDGIGKRLKLEVGTFEIKYLDDDHEWVLRACDADMQECVDIAKSSGSHLIRLMVHDIVPSFGSSCESSGECGGGRGCK